MSKQPRTRIDRLITTKRLGDVRCLGPLSEKVEHYFANDGSHGHRMCGVCRHIIRNVNMDGDTIRVCETPWGTSGPGNS